MQRFTHIARVSNAGRSSSFARVTGPRFAGPVARYSVGNKSEGEAIEKNKHDAKQASEQKAPTSEGHSLDRQSHAKQHQDAHTAELSKAGEQREGQRDSGSDIDAVNLSHGKNDGKAQAQKESNETEKMPGYQPGVKGEQVGGQAASGEPLKEGEGMAGTKKAPKRGAIKGLGEVAKNMMGQGPSSGFHTYARLRFPGSTGAPESAVDQGAREPKDTSVKGMQTQHLPHHKAGEGDKMPAVQNDAKPPKTPEPGEMSSSSGAGAKRSYSTSSIVRGTGTNTGKGPSAERRPTGTANSPGSRAVDPQSGTHSPSFAPSTGPQATYTHVLGNPEPDSHRTNYQYTTQSAGGHLPSGTAPRSSTSRDSYPEHATADSILKNEAGIGSSNKKIDDPLKAADEMVAQQEVGQAGDDAGGRQTGGVPYNQPPDVGEVHEDTLPKPIQQ